MAQLRRWQQASPRRHRHAVLGFHDVRDRRWFEAFLRALAQRVEVVSLAELVRRHEHDKAAPACVALTFDDGFASLRSVVEPVCSELGLPFTAFVCGEVLDGGPPPWTTRVEQLLARHDARQLAAYWTVAGRPDGRDLLLALKALPMAQVLQGLQRAERDAGIDLAALRTCFLDAGGLAALARNPLVTVGSHSYSHPILSQLGAAELWLELRRGLDALRRACGTTAEFFAYPNGKPHDFNDGVVRMLREAGVRAAVTTVQRPLRRDEDVMRLPRLGVSEGDPVDKLELKWSLPWLSTGDLREWLWRLRQ
jgi:peptidoglycan/xylan/chitin deacetylase (PgdA/CDA1 family)